MIRSNSREALNSMLSSAVEIQIKLLSLTEENLDSTISIFDKNPFLNNKLSLRKLLFMTNHMMICHPLRYPLFMQFLTKLLPKISSFFCSDELFSIFEMNKPVLSLLFENNIVHINHLDKNLDFYVDNQDHFLFFFREIEAFSKRRFNEILNSNPEFEDFVNNAKDVEQYNKSRKSGFNESPIAQSIRDDDLALFQKIVPLSKLSSEVPHSIFEVTQFDMLFDSCPSLIEYSAFFGATKILNYLLSKRVFIDSNLMRYAIAGGFVEVVDIVYKKIPNFKFDTKCLNTAIQFYRQQIVDYLHQTIPFDFFSLTSGIESYNVQIMIQVLKEENIELSEDENNWNALHIAASSGQLETVRFLIEEKKLDVNSRNNLGNTALQLASENGFVDIVRFLLTFREIDINLENDEKGNALHYAVRNDHLDVVRLLCGFDERKATALADRQNKMYTRAANCFVEVNDEAYRDETGDEEDDDEIQENEFNEFTNENVNLNESVNENVNKIVDESENGDENRSKCQNSIDKNCNNKTNIDNDVLNNDEDRNIKADNNINAGNNNLFENKKTNVNNASRTCALKSLSKGISKKNQKESQLESAAHCVDLNARNSNAETPLFVACRHSFIDIIEFLVELDSVDLDAVAENDQTPLHVCCRYGLLVVTEILCRREFVLKRRVDLNAKGKKGMTPLLIAIQCNHLKIVQFLLKNFSKEFSDHCCDQNCNKSNNNNINKNENDIENENDGSDENNVYFINFYAEDKNKENALLYAAEGDEKLRIMKFLIENGKFKSDFIKNSVNKNGENVFHIAAKNGAVETYKYLIGCSEIRDLSDCCDNNGKKPIDLFSKEKRTVLNELFQDK